MLLPSIFCLPLTLLLLLLRGRYTLLPLPVVICDTRCCCAAAVLLLCYIVAATVLLFFPVIIFPGTTHSQLPVSPIYFFRSDKLHDVPTFLRSGLLFTKICVFINIVTFSAEQRWLVETDGSPSSRFPCPLPPPPLPFPAIVRG